MYEMLESFYFSKTSTLLFPFCFQPNKKLCGAFQNMFTNKNAKENAFHAKVYLHSLIANGIIQYKWIP